MEKPLDLISRLGGEKMKKIIMPLILILIILATISTTLASLPQDLNNDGKVDVADLKEAAESFGSYPGHLRWNSQADMNGDGMINLKDLYLIASSFGKTG